MFNHSKDSIKTTKLELKHDLSSLIFKKIIRKGRRFLGTFFKILIKLLILSKLQEKINENIDWKCEREYFLVNI